MESLQFLDVADAVERLSKGDKGFAAVVQLADHVAFTPDPPGDVIVGMRAGGDVLPHLDRFPDLQWLEVGGARVTTESADRIAGLKNLRGLQLAFRTMNDEAARILRQLPALESLSLANTNVTDETVRSLKENETLRCLDLSGTQVTDEGIETLRSLRRLEVLFLRYPPDSVHAPRISDTSARHLGRMESLRVLSLVDAPITDVGLSELRSLSGLRELDISGCELTPLAVAALARALPECRITWMRMADSNSPVASIVKRIGKPLEIEIGGFRYRPERVTVPATAVGSRGVRDERVGTVNVLYRQPRDPAATRFEINVNFTPPSEPAIPDPDDKRPIALRGGFISVILQVEHGDNGQWKLVSAVLNYREDLLNSQDPVLKSFGDQLREVVEGVKAES